MICEYCEHRKELSIGMDSKGREKFGNICTIQPLASEKVINTKTNEPFGYENLGTKYLKKEAPTWCPLKKNKKKGN